MEGNNDLKVGDLILAKSKNGTPVVGMIAAISDVDLDHTTMTFLSVKFDDGNTVSIPANTVMTITEEILEIIKQQARDLLLETTP